MQKISPHHSSKQRLKELLWVLIWATLLFSLPLFGLENIPSAPLLVRAKVRPISSIKVSAPLKHAVDLTLDPLDGEVVTSESQLDFYSNSRGKSYVKLVSMPGYTETEGESLHFIMLNACGCRLRFTLQSRKEGEEWCDCIEHHKILYLDPTETSHLSCTLRAKISGSQIRKVSAGDYNGYVSIEHWLEE